MAKLRVKVITHARGPLHRHFDRLESMILRDAGHIGPESFLDILKDALLAILRAEDQINAIAAIGVRHRSSLRDYYTSVNAYPGLPSWAKLVRSSGACLILPLNLCTRATFRSLVSNPNPNLALRGRPVDDLLLALRSLSPSAKLAWCRTRALKTRP